MRSSARMRQKYNFPGKLTTRIHPQSKQGNEFRWSISLEILVLPHSGGGSRQLLLYITETSADQVLTHVQMLHGIPQNTMDYEKQIMKQFFNCYNTDISVKDIF